MIWVFMFMTALGVALASVSAATAESRRPIGTRMPRRAERLEAWNRGERARPSSMVFDEQVIRPLRRFELPAILATKQDREDFEADKRLAKHNNVEPPRMARWE